MTTLPRLLIEGIRRGFHSVGIDIHRVREQTRATPSEIARMLQALREGSSPEIDFLKFCAARLGQSRSQLLQDLWVLHHTGEKRGGYFVEFGAADGVSLSNSYLLEAEYGWSGIVAEAARAWQAKLRATRKCHVSDFCVWEASGRTLEFVQAPSAELSTIGAFTAADRHEAGRAGGERYPVRTISLLDLLDSCGAPRDIDFLSVDTEGSELRILQAFDFARYRFGCICVEHNYTPAREQVHTLLSRAGYRRVLESLSMWDDWYVGRH